MSESEIPRTSADLPAEADASQEPAKRPPRRGRVAVELAQCSLGEIRNLSPSGLRARYKGSRANLPKVDERFDMDLPTPDGPAAVRVRVAWIKRVGFRKHDIGLHFVAVDERSAALLRQFATMAGRAPIITRDTGGSRLRAG
jgi:hypothetical protein